jgi:bifunctional non-homologous end joining protein LigD
MSAKSAVKPLQECVKEAETIELYFQQGSSDKVYHLQLESIEEQWSVNAQWGRRGSALQSDSKVSSVAYEEAKRVYDRIIREKTGKGYRIAQATTNGNTPISVGLPSVKEHSGHAPELLFPIEEPEAVRLVGDEGWWFQQKFDGRRLAVQKTDGQYSGINKLGQLIPIDSRLTQSLESVQAQAFLVDGEITDSRFHLWDLLSINGTDLRIQPYEIRYARLGLVFRGVNEALRVCETAMTPKAKRAFVKAMHESRAEGFVCKNRYATYAGGRAGQHFKCKFVTTASFIVGPKPAAKAADGHRSIGLYLLEEDRQRFMGTVGVPERYALPRDGQVVEIRYLYCHLGADGKLIQAKYFGTIRNDVGLADCSVNQLKLKADESDPTDPERVPNNPTEKTTAV